MFRVEMKTTAPNCIKAFLDLPGDSGPSCLILQQLPEVILANPATIVSNGNNCNVKPDWPE